MKILDTKNIPELIQSILAENAKTVNEVKCARADLDKATSRLKFSLMLLNVILERTTIGEHNGSKESSE